MVNLENGLKLKILDILPTIQHSIMHRSTYFGVTTYKNPLDAWVYQELIVELKPLFIIEIGNKFGGSALMMAHWLDQMGSGSIIAIDVDHSRVSPIAAKHPRIKFIDGDGVGVVDQVRDLVPPGASVLIIEDSSHTFENTLKVLEAYCGFIQPGGYFIIEDSILNHGLARPKLDRGPYEAIHEFISRHPEFEIDRSREKYLITWNPCGFLRRKTDG